MCLEDGKKSKSLKRHLRTQYNITPEQYREKRGLPANYPMVAPNYAKARSERAKEMGLGRQRRKGKTAEDGDAIKPGAAAKAEWALIAPALPLPSWRGRPRTTDLRAVVEALLDLLSTGCQWRALPREFPPRSTVQRSFYRWRNTGLWERLNRQLVGQARQALGRRPQPSLGIIDSQSVATTESGGPRGRGAGVHGQGREGERSTPLRSSRRSTEPSPDAPAIRSSS